MSDEKHKFCFVCERRIDNLKRENVKIVKLNYIKQIDKRQEFLRFFNKNEKHMGMNENVCKKHITKLNKNFTSSYFYDHNNKENEEITNNVIDSIDEVPLNNF